MAVAFAASSMILQSWKLFLSLFLTKGWFFFFVLPFCFSFLLKQSTCLLGPHCTLCSSSAWALGSQTLKTFYTSCSHIHRVPVLSLTQRLSVGGPSPLLLLPTLLAPLRLVLARNVWVTFVLLFQKRLTIQGKSVDMHYSHPRNKYEDWLCNTVS